MSFWRLYYHLVWATKQRLPLIKPELEAKLQGASHFGKSLKYSNENTSVSKHKRKCSVQKWDAPKLHGYIIGKADYLGCITHAINGTENHIHIVASIPPDLSISQFVKRIKGSSSHHWSHTLTNNSDKFYWQEGYGVFSLGSKQFTNNQEKRSRYLESIRTLSDKFTMSKLKIILLVCLISFTSLLVRETLQIQHSCRPMLRLGTLAAECQIVAKDNSNLHTQKEFKTSKQPTQIAQDTSKSEPHKVTHSSKVPEPKISKNIESESKTQSNPVGQFVNEHSDDIVGGVAGIAGGVGIMAAASATAAFSIPVAGAVAIGLGIWFAIRTVF